jgi:gluconate kinase
MPATLLESQFEALQEPTAGESPLTLDAHAPLEQNLNSALVAINGRLSDARE